MRFGLSLLFTSLASLAWAGDFSLTSPIHCALGEDQQCYIQSYMDRDASSGFHEFTCQDLSYDGHKGTDFAVRNYAEIQSGVPVIASADGIVKGVRDGMIDKVFTPQDAQALKGRDCGNGVVLGHEDGWETQYCHLRQGSLAVKNGDPVKKGDVLGMVGMSGRASYPHIHLSVRKNGRPVDPFAPTGQNVCGSETSDTLWDAPISYQAGGIISAGFSANIPDFKDIKAGTSAKEVLPQSSKALVLWGFIFGGRAEDVINLEILDPNGDPVFTQDIVLEKSQPQLFRAGGRKTRNADWFSPGQFTGTVRLIRNGTVQSDTTTQVLITNER